MKMPKGKYSFEQAMVFAFDLGMQTGYGIEHTDVVNQENEAIEHFLKEYDFTYSLKELRQNAKRK